MPVCTICQATAAALRRKFCSAACAREGVRRWKRAMREQLRAEWQAKGSEAKRTAQPPWKDGWNDDEVRKKYQREYMRRRRQAQRLRAARRHDVGVSQSWHVSETAVSAS